MSEALGAAGCGSRRWRHQHSNVAISIGSLGGGSLAGWVIRRLPERTIPQRLRRLVSPRGVSSAGRDQGDPGLIVLIDLDEENVGDSRSAWNPGRSASRVGQSAGRRNLLEHRHLRVLGVLAASAYQARPLLHRHPDGVCGLLAEVTRVHIDFPGIEPDVPRDQLSLKLRRVST